MTLTITLTNLDGRDAGEISSAILGLFNIHNTVGRAIDGDVNMDEAREQADRYLDELKDLVVRDLECFGPDEIPEHFHGSYISNEDLDNA